MDNQAYVIKDLTIILIFLTRFKDKGRFASIYEEAWKGYSFDVINELAEDEYLINSRSSKKVCITDKGKELAESLIKKYRLLDK